MLLQFIVQEFDRELDRLDQLRRIVISLSRTPVSMRKLTLAAEEAPTLPETPGPQARRRTRSRKREATSRVQRMVNLPEPATRAFARSVPVGPVVINPGQLAREQEQRVRSGEAEQP
jgi:hypothetical protein